MQPTAPLHSTLPTAAGSPYRLVLSSELDDLPDALRKLHEFGGCATGVFDVVQGTTACHTILARLFALPRPGQRQPVRLVVTAQEGRQKWDRTIGMHAFRSTQWASAGTLVEEVGAFQFHFVLSVSEGSLRFHQQRVTWHRLPLPSWCTPTVEAVASGRSMSGWQVTVTISCPPFGVVTRYEGPMELA